VRYKRNRDNRCYRIEFFFHYFFSHNTNYLQVLPPPSPPPSCTRTSQRWIDINHHLPDSSKASTATSGNDAGRRSVIQSSSTSPDMAICCISTTISGRDHLQLPFLVFLNTCAYSSSSSNSRVWSVIVYNRYGHSGVGTAAS
jgi:hypothetical protein